MFGDSGVENSNLFFWNAPLRLSSGAMMGRFAPPFQAPASGDEAEKPSLGAAEIVDDRGNRPAAEQRVGDAAGAAEQAAGPGAGILNLDEAWDRLRRHTDCGRRGR